MLVSNFSKRLKEAMEIKNIKSVEIVKQSEHLYNIGKIKKPLTRPLITNYLQGKYEAKQDNLIALSIILDVNQVWLMGYDVPMYVKEQKPINDMFEYNTNNFKRNRIPVLGKIPAGIPINAIQENLGYEELSDSMLKGGKEYFALKVKGSSMEPEYLEDDVLIVLKQTYCDDGDDCIVMVNGDDATFKRIHKDEINKTIMLQPLNTEYLPVTYTNKQIEELPVKILGVVKEIRRKKVNKKKKRNYYN